MKKREVGEGPKTTFLTLSFSIDEHSNANINK